MIEMEYKLNRRCDLFFALALAGIGAPLGIDEEIACLADNVCRRARLRLEETLHPLALASKLLLLLLLRRRWRREPRHRRRGSPSYSLFRRTDSYCVCDDDRRSQGLIIVALSFPFCLLNCKAKPSQAHTR